MIRKQIRRMKSHQKVKRQRHNMRASRKGRTAGGSRRKKDVLKVSCVRKNKEAGEKVGGSCSSKKRWLKLKL